MRTGLVDLGADNWFLLANESMPTSTKSFWDSMWSLGYRGHNLTDGKYLFYWIPLQPTLPGPPSSCWWNSGLWLISCHFTRLEPAGLPYLEHSAGESPRRQLTPIWLSCFCPLPREWGWLATKYMLRACRPFRHLGVVVAKNDSDIESMATKNPINTSQPFSD